MSHASTPVAGHALPASGPDPVVDRAIWERLRRAAYKGQLQGEGMQLLDELHELYPEWRAEW